MGLLGGRALWQTGGTSGAPPGGEGGRVQFSRPLSWSCGRAMTSVPLSLPLMLHNVPNAPLHERLSLLLL